MFRDLTSVIREKLYIEAGGTYSYPRLIQWCLDNNMVQQALTLYIEKMPEYYCSQGLLEFSQEEAQKSRQNQGKTWRTEYFYGPFYDQLVMRDFKEFVERLKAGYQAMRDTYPLLEQSEADRFRKLKDYMKTPQEKKAVDRLIAFLKRYYGGVPRKIIHPYTGKKMEGSPKNANGFVKAVMNNEKWQIHFYYDDKKMYDKCDMEIYEKKVYALEEIKACKEKIPKAGTEDNRFLYDCMRYYLALKIIRNRINHASEQDIREDEKWAVEQIEKEHGICMDIELENVKSLIQEGIDLYKEAPKTDSHRISVKRDLRNTISAVKRDKVQ